MGAQLRVVRRRIRSVQSTKKITRAMELIASSRIVKAQQRVEASRPYAVQLTEAMEDLARNAVSFSHPLLEEREEPRTAAILVCTSDRGLAGAYAANVIKEAEGVLADVRRRGLEPVVYVSGKKGVGYFASLRRFWYGEYCAIHAHSSGLSGSPYSAIHDAPASSRWYLFMSRSGTWHTIAPNSSG